MFGRSGPTSLTLVNAALLDAGYDGPASCDTLKMQGSNTMRLSFRCSCSPKSLSLAVNRRKARPYLKVMSLLDVDRECAQRLANKICSKHSECHLSEYTF